MNNNISSWQSFLIRKWRVLRKIRNVQVSFQLQFTKIHHIDTLKLNSLSPVYCVLLNVILSCQVDLLGSTFYYVEIHVPLVGMKMFLFEFCRIAFLLFSNHRLILGNIFFIYHSFHNDSFTVRFGGQIKLYNLICK